MTATAGIGLIPGDFYCKALGYLGEALKLTPKNDTILAESARMAADHARKKALNYWDRAIPKALG